MSNVNVEEKFFEIVAEYCDVKPEDMNLEMSFLEDLGFSSFDFMSFLGELEDTFDVEVEEDEVLQIRTLGEAVEYLHSVL